MTTCWWAFNPVSYLSNPLEEVKVFAQTQKLGEAEGWISEHLRLNGLAPSNNTFCVCMHVHVCVHMRSVVIHYPVSSLPRCSPEPHNVHCVWRKWLHPRNDRTTSFLYCISFRLSPLLWTRLHVLSSTPLAILRFYLYPCLLFYHSGSLHLLHYFLPMTHFHSPSAPPHTHLLCPFVADVSTTCLLNEGWSDERPHAFM